MEISDIEAIFKILKNSDIAEFELEQDGTRIKLVRGSSGIVVANGQFGGQPSIVGVPSGGFAHMPTESLAYASTGNNPVNDDSAAYVKVESPIVGTFYRRSSPDSEPFVKEGDIVKKGSTLCIIEAMKLMNEIEAPCSGSIEKVLLGDGQVVEYGEILFLIKPEL